MSDQQPDSLLDVWVAYEKHMRATLPLKKAEASLAQTRTALLRYTLPHWLPYSSMEGQRLTAKEFEQRLNQFKELDYPLILFLEVSAEAQEEVFDVLQVPGNSRRNYRWALKKFLDWCREQPWIGLTTLNFPQPVTPRKRQKKGSATEVRLTTRKLRKHYSLTEAEISEPLQQELDAFHQWLVNVESPRRQRDQLGAKAVLQALLRFLGWLYRVRKVPLDQLSLEALVEYYPRASMTKQARERQRAEAAALSLKSLVCAYYLWLGTDLDAPETVKHGPHSLEPERRTIKALLAVARYHYKQDMAADAQEDAAVIPLFQELHSLKARLEDLRKYSPDDSLAKQWLDWSEFLAFVERLRQECVPRFRQNTQASKPSTTLGTWRTATAIAHSYQRFLLTALLAYLPPQRQQVLRHLKFLPPSDVANLEPSSDLAAKPSLLYRKDKTWLLKISQQKPESHSPDVEFTVPNIEYPDKQRFYEYLEAWLLNYAPQAHENKTMAASGLRHCFHPHHFYFFTMKNGQPYTNASVFADLLSNPAFRLTGKVLTPDLVRDMFITQLLKNKTPYLELTAIAELMEYEPKQIEVLIGKLRSLDAVQPEINARHLPAKIAREFLQQT